MTDKKQNIMLYTKNKYGENMTMGLQVENGNISQNSIIASLYSKAQNYTSNLLNSDTREFADYLKSNFDEIDKNNDNSLTKNEIAAHTLLDLRNELLKILLYNISIEKLTANIDTNKDGSISYSETNPDGNVPNILKGALREIQTTQNWGMTAQNLAQNLCKNYYASPMLASAAQSAISCLL